MKKERGITLVSLVITVIIMLILAGVALSLITGTDGLFARTNHAARQYENASQKEADIVNQLLNSEYMVGVGRNASELVQENSEKELATEYYGKYITNYKPEGLTDLKWRIFYIGKDSTGEGETNIYLIADHYVPRDELPIKDGIQPHAGDDTGGLRTAYCGDVLTKYAEGSDEITDSNLAYNWLSKWNKYLAENNTVSTNSNIKAVAYMLDTEIWDKFNVNNNSNQKMAKYIIGGPTLELFVASYNQAHDEKISIGVGIGDEASPNFKGYKVGLSESSLGKSVAISDDTNLWVPAAQYNANVTGYDEREAMCMWVASPSAYDTAAKTVSINHDNYVSRISCHNTNLGFRPVVCLKSDAKLITKDNGATYEIKE